VPAKNACPPPSANAIRRTWGSDHREIGSLKTTPSRPGAQAGGADYAQFAAESAVPCGPLVGMYARRHVRLRPRDARHRDVPAPGPRIGAIPLLVRRVRAPRPDVPQTRRPVLRPYLRGAPDPARRPLGLAAPGLRQGRPRSCTLTTQDLRSLRTCRDAAPFVTAKGRLIDWVNPALAPGPASCSPSGRSVAVADYIERYTFRESQVENADVARTLVCRARARRARARCSAIAAERPAPPSRSRLADAGGLGRHLPAAGALHYRGPGLAPCAPPSWSARRARRGGPRRARGPSDRGRSSRGRAE